MGLRQSQIPVTEGLVVPGEIFGFYGERGRKKSDGFEGSDRILFMF